MNKIVVNVIVVIILLMLMSIFLKMYVNCTDYMHKKCCETNYSLCHDI